MRAAIIDEPGSIRVGRVEDPSPGLQEVVVRVGACGICGSDLHIADGDLPGTRYPVVPGHEFAGEVVALGPGADGLSEGAQVVVDPAIPCDRCEFCRRGRPNLCQNPDVIGATVPGGFAEYVTVPAANAYTLPEGVSHREAALIEPISCAVHGIRRLSPQVGETFLIFGAGTTGLILLQLALRGGASRVSVVNRSPRRLPLTERLGAARMATDVRELLEDEPLGFDCVIDATGAPGVIETAFEAVKPGGKLLIFGVASPEARVSLSPYQIYRNDITVLGSMAFLFSFAPAIDLLLGGAVNAAALLSHEFALEEFPGALDAVRRGEGVKVQVLPTG